VSDAGLDLFKAVRAALVGDATVNGFVVGRVFSSWANAAAPPLIRMSLGRAERFEIDTADGPADGSETPISIHIFAKEDAPDVSRRVAARVRIVLQDAPMALDTSHTVAFQYRDTIQIQDGDDPALQMAVVRFTALTTAK
jgi:hypothetical protein